MHDRYVGHGDVTFFPQQLVFSQLEHNQEDTSFLRWKNSLCGLSCAMMVLDTFTVKKHNPSELFELAVKNSAYDSSRGWIHAKLAELLQNYGIFGKSEFFQGSSQLYSRLRDGNLIVASVSFRYMNISVNPFRRKSGHLVLVTQMLMKSDGQYDVRLHDPGSEDIAGGENIILDWELFNSNFSGNIISFKKMQEL